MYVYIYTYIYTYIYNGSDLDGRGAEVVGDRARLAPEHVERQQPLPQRLRTKPTILRFEFYLDRPYESAGLSR